MNNSIKEILEYYQKDIDKFEYYMSNYNDEQLKTTFSKNYQRYKNHKILLNYITNLQNENQEFYQLMEMQNKREYRSKFLKDFQKEHGKNVLPDYDEIYKKYDDYKQRNEKAVEYIKERKDLNWYADGVFVYELLNILQGGDE